MSSFKNWFPCIPQNESCTSFKRTLSSRASLIRALDYFAKPCEMEKHKGAGLS